MATDDADAPGRPPFLRYGAFTVGVFVVAVTAVRSLSGLDLRGPQLATFAAGFAIFMAIYFFSMWVAWLYFE